MPDLRDCIREAARCEGEDITDWQRGYRACSERVLAVLDEGGAGQKVAEVRGWAASRMSTWGEDSVSGQVLAEMLRILDGTVPKAGADRTWLDDCRFNGFPGLPFFASAMHLPTGIWAQANGATAEKARWAAIADLGDRLVARGKISVNDVRKALGMRPWPQDACVDEPAADLASEAGAL